MNPREQHITVGKYLKDMIFAANDGVVTTFAVIAGVAGAELPAVIILIVGFANVLADGFSMATGNYLGTKAEQEFYDRERQKEIEEIDTIRDREIAEIREILEKRGYRGKDLEEFVRLLASNKDCFADFMMHEELGLFKPDRDSPMRHAAATFISFAIAGAIPLLPYVFGLSSSFAAASILAGLTLFGTGASRRYFSGKSWIVSGGEMLLVGGAASVIAYIVGALLRNFVA